MAKNRFIPMVGIIHNEEVVRDLEKKGVSVIETEEELRQLSGGTVIIRSHGVGCHIYQMLEERGVEIVDATCPFVKKSTESYRNRIKMEDGSSLSVTRLIQRWKASVDGEMRKLW